MPQADGDKMGAPDYQVDANSNISAVSRHPSALHARTYSANKILRIG